MAPAALVRTLTKRSEFLAANRGHRFPVPGFVLLVRKRGDQDDVLGIGYTVSKKVGNAVIRNRMKRRLRALVREQLPAAGVPGADHVLIGRHGGNDLAYADLSQHLANALRRAHKKLEQGDPPGPPHDRKAQPRRRGKNQSARIAQEQPAQAISASPNSAPTPPAPAPDEGGQPPPIIREKG